MLSASIALLRAGAAWSFTGVYWIGFFALHALTLKRLPPAFVQNAVRWWGRSSLSLLGIRLEILNSSTIEGRAARVIVCNHQSALDMLLLAAVCPPAPLAMGKKEIIWVPFVNLAWWTLDLIRVDRENPRKTVAALDGIARKLALNQRSLVIAPEGARTRDGQFLPFKRGAFLIAVKSQAPIYPIVISGAFELLPRHKYLPKTGVIRLRFLPPLDTRGISEQAVGELCRKVRQVMIMASEASLSV